MSYSQEAKIESFVASGDLSGCLNRVVTLLTDFVVGIGTVGKSYGVLTNDPKDNEHAAVATDGITLVRVGAAVTAGDYLTSSASGWAVTVVSTITDVASGSDLSFIDVLGRAETGAASGMLAALNLKQHSRVASF